MARDVVLGVDGSPASSRATDVAVELVRSTGGSLIVACIVPWSPYEMRTPAELDRRSVEKEREIEQARVGVVAPALERLAECNATLEVVIRHGHPAETLASLAVDRDAAHLVVGRTGQSRIRSAMFGSTAGTLIQIADVPVTVVP
jgi:nucleotide-binding universal stress UspA family protein